MIFAEYGLSLVSFFIFPINLKFWLVECGHFLIPFYRFGFIGPAIQPGS